MGLDVSAYSNLAKVDDDHPIARSEDPSEFGAVRIYKTEFDRAPELEHYGVYLPRERYGFSAGSYGGYNRWRNWLSQLVGFENAEEVWRDPKPGPFVELINFSDCEGTIGAQVAKKLAKDFAEREFGARLSSGRIETPWYFELYMRFKRAFEIASNGGAVTFH